MPRRAGSSATSRRARFSPSPNSLRYWAASVSVAGQSSSRARWRAPFPNRSRRPAAASPSIRCARRCRSRRRRCRSVIIAAASMSRRHPRPAQRCLRAGTVSSRPAATSVDSGGFAGFAAVDSKGGAAACAVSMGQLFGARVVVPGSGIMLGSPNPEAASVSPMHHRQSRQRRIHLRRCGRRWTDGRPGRRLRGARRHRQ